MNKYLNIKKTVFTVITLNSIQIAIVAGLLIYELIFHKGVNLSYPFRDMNFLLGVILGIILINSYMMLRDAYILHRVRFQDEMIKETLIQVEDLNTSLRCQRHDFLNHLQIVYSLIELQEYQEAQDYLDRVYGDIQKVSRVLKTANPAVNALLQAKIIACEKREIKVHLEITSQLSDLPVPAWEMCRILANLIDNAMDALAEINKERALVIEIYEDLKFFGFRVENNGPPIPHNQWEKIYEANFTTKGDQGEGMGLAIVKELISRYHGIITVSSNEKATIFEGQIPKVLL